MPFKIVVGVIVGIAAVCVATRRIITAVNDTIDDFEDLSK